MDQSITNQLIIMESLCGRGLFWRRGEGPVGEGGEGLSTSFLSIFLYHWYQNRFWFGFLVYFSKMLWW